MTIRDLLEEKRYDRPIVLPIMIVGFIASLGMVLSALF